MLQEPRAQESPLLTSGPGTDACACCLEEAGLEGEPGRHPPRSPLRGITVGGRPVPSYGRRVSRKGVQASKALWRSIYMGAEGGGTEEEEGGGEREIGHAFPENYFTA